MTEKILLVDDDANLLAGFQRNLRQQFHLHTAEGGEMGLQLVADHGPFAVVITDMSMPVMNGIEFLSQVDKAAPDSVRMMLTGNADQQTAIDAVNEGHIFRFLTKPCSTETLAKAVTAGIRQYQLIRSEQELLENTLHGTIRTLTDVLSLVQPEAFSRAIRLKSYITHICAEMGIPAIWQIEVAAMLSQIGCVTLPPDLLRKVYGRKTLSSSEESMFSSHPETGCQLLENIPRLESVAKMIADQQKPFADVDSSRQNSDQEKIISLGAQMLQVALGFDDLIKRGATPQKAMTTLLDSPDDYNPKIVIGLEHYQHQVVIMTTKELRVQDLEEGMFTAKDIEAKNGLLIVPERHEITASVLQRLVNFSVNKGMGVKEPVHVNIVSDNNELLDDVESTSQPLEV